MFTPLFNLISSFWSDLPKNHWAGQIVAGCVITNIDIVQIMIDFYIFRNARKLPFNPGMKEYIGQFIVVFSLLGPKIWLAATVVINAPYQFGIIYLFEYGLLLLHNLLLYKDAFCK